MKKLCSLLGVLAVALLVGCDQATVADGEGDSKAVTRVAAFEGEENVVTFNVPGMTCEGCASMVEDTLAHTDGIEKCIVDLESKVATCKVNPEKFKADDVLKALADAGYEESTLKN